MQTTAVLLGAGAFGLVAGAMGGLEISTQPIPAATADLLAGIPQHQIAEKAQARKGPRPPDHYPLVTPEGTVPVEQLAVYGVMRDRGYGNPYQHAYDPALGEDFAYSDDWNYYEDGPGAKQSEAEVPTRVAVSARYDNEFSEPAAHIAQGKPVDLKLDDIPTIALPTEAEPIVSVEVPSLQPVGSTVANLSPGQTINLQ